MGFQIAVELIHYMIKKKCNKCHYLILKLTSEKSFFNKIGVSLLKGFLHTWQLYLKIFYYFCIINEDCYSIFKLEMLFQVSCFEKAWSIQDMDIMKRVQRLFSCMLGVFWKHFTYTKGVVCLFVLLTFLQLFCLKTRLFWSYTCWSLKLIGKLQRIYD